jgi:hypothetical protein
MGVMRKENRMVCFVITFPFHFNFTKDTVAIGCRSKLAGVCADKKKKERRNRIRVKKRESKKELKP